MFLPKVIESHINAIKRSFYMIQAFLHIWQMRNQLENRIKLSNCFFAQFIAICLFHYLQLYYEF